ncbi:brachyurin-like isoform X1 [Daphnia pulicaria]|uniref:brachyurin-like isoform X1 n=1 Tax=Daphnia pulicaria TaxID=35523 RepID=UPI001EECF122|nr:brachyurin-like isoform X1 [Daphnia pulicaria]
MLGNQKGFSTAVVLLAVVSLLSCCGLASSFAFLPRVSRTKDAIIINFADVESAPSSQAKSLNDQIADPAFVQVPSFNPHPMTFRQQQQQPSGWSYSFGHPSPIAFEDAWFSSRQLSQVDEQQAVEEVDLKQSVAPACGRGPTTFPTTRASISERIAGGINAKKNAWPFMVALLLEGVMYCGGTLISDTKVLLAAQCLERMPLHYMSLLTVSVGLHSVLPLDAPLTRRINKAVLHNNFNAANYTNDIAIITLDAPVTFTRTITPVCLPPASSDPDQYADQSAVILGWDKPDNAVLQQGTVSISSNSECRMDPAIGQYVSDASICVTSTTKFTCTKDIGGPVVVLSSPGVWTQVGINSYTKDDCASPGLKTRVSALRAWINTYMK